MKRQEPSESYPKQDDMVLFDCTAKQWQEANPELAKTMNIRDTATINQLIVLSNIESLNAELIKQGVSKEDRFTILRRTATELPLFHYLCPVMADLIGHLRQKQDLI